MKRGLAALAAAVALVAVPLAAADANFSDATNDAAGAPDIVGVVVANDSQNRVAFEVKLAGELVLPEDSELAFVIDSDQSVDTGRDGWDYLVIVAGDESSSLLRWDGTTWVEAPSATARVWVIGGYVLYGIDRSELGNTAAFDFAVESVKIANEAVAARDSAPDGDGFWSYAAVTKTYGIAGTPLVVKPARPAAKAKVAASFVTVRTDSLEPLLGAKSTCKATVAGKRVATRVKGDLGFAVCETVAKLPKTAKGKLLKITMTTSVGGKTVTKTYSEKVR